MSPDQVWEALKEQCAATADRSKVKTLVMVRKADIGAAFVRPDLKELIEAVIAKKQGNKEFALFYLEPEWCAEIGNTCVHVMLGESEGEFRGKGSTPEEAVQNLLEQLP